MAKTYSRAILEGEIPQFAYALAVLSGGVVYVAAQLVTPPKSWFAYAFIAMLFASIWPYNAMQWGGWICLPIALMIVLDVISTGNIINLLMVSGVVLVKALSFACLGAYAGSKLSIHRISKLVAQRKNPKRKRSGAQSNAVLTEPGALDAGLKTSSSGPDAGPPVQLSELIAHLKAVNAALMSAAPESDIDRNKLLVANGAEAKAQDRQQWIRPGLAIRDCDVERGLALFGKGVLPEPSNGKSWTPLMLAIIEGHPEIVRDLLVSGAEVDAENYEGWTAVRLAVSMDESAILRLLLDAGADANVADQEGQTALMQAARENSGDSLKVLLDAGADPLIEDQRRRTALKLAREHDYTEIIRLLEEAEAKTSPGIVVSINTNGIEVSAEFSPCEG